MILKEMNTDIIVQLYENSENESSAKVKLENELKVRISENKKYSKEDLFRICKTQDRRPTLLLFPTTNSYNIIGREITIELILTDEETIDYLTRLKNPEERSYGKINVRLAARQHLDEEKISKIENNGIDTNEIYEIL